MSFFPLLMAGYAAEDIGPGILKGGIDRILGIWYQRPRDLEGDPCKYTYVQDLDIGSACGRFYHLHRGPYYRRHMARIRDSGMSMATITDRPAAKVVDEIARDAIYGGSKVIATNGGACVYVLTNPTATNPVDRYELKTDLKISEESVQELRDVMEDVSTASRTRNMPLGAFVVNTKDSRNIYVPDGTTLFARMRISFGLKRRNIIGTAIDSSVKRDARNISFEIFPKFSHDLVVKRTSFGLINKAMGGPAFNGEHHFLDRWLNSRFIRYVGRYNPFYVPADGEAPHDPRFLNLPTLRNLLWRHKNTNVDGLNQEDVIRKALIKLVVDDHGNPRDPATTHYLSDTCVTLSTKGLEFVPVGASKIEALQKLEPIEPPDPAKIPDFAKLPADVQASIQKEHDNWENDHHLWETDLDAYAKGPGAERAKECMINGDNFSDFFVPVSLKDLQTEYMKAVNEELAAATREGRDPKPIDILDVYYKLSKPPAKMTFDDVNNMAIRYNVTGNSLSGMALDMKTAEAQQRAALAEEIEQTITQPRQALVEEEKKIIKEMMNLENAFRLGRISGDDYKAKKSEFEKQMDENRKKKARYAAALPGLMDEKKKKAEALKKNPISDDNLDTSVHHNAKTGQQVLSRINEVTSRTH